MHTKYTLSCRVSPQWLSKLRWLWPSILCQVFVSSFHWLHYPHTMPGQHSQSMYICFYVQPWVMSAHGGPFGVMRRVVFNCVNFAVMLTGHSRAKSLFFCLFNIFYLLDRACFQRASSFKWSQHSLISDDKPPLFETTFSKTFFNTVSYTHLTLPTTILV